MLMFPCIGDTNPFILLFEELLLIVNEALNLEDRNLEDTIELNYLSLTFTFHWFWFWNYNGFLSESSNE